MFFGCTGLTTIPNDLFRYNTSITGFALTFKGCTSLVNLPNNLFYYNSLVTSYLGTLEDMVNVILPTTLFNLTNLSIVTSFNNFLKASSTGNSGTGTIQDIWNYALSAASKRQALEILARELYRIFGIMPYQQLVPMLS